MRFNVRLKPIKINWSFESHDRDECDVVGGESDGAGGEDVWVSGDSWGVDKEYCDVVDEYRGVAGAGIGVVSESCDGGVGWADYEGDGDAEDDVNGPDCAIKK